VAEAALYRQDIGGCLAAAVGARGLGKDELEALLARTRPALERLKAWHRDGGLPLLRLPARREDLAVLGRFAGEVRRKFINLVVLGTGGSSLGGQTLVALADQGFGPRPGAPKIHFMDNIDPASFAALFAALDPMRTGILAISKSGGTAETLAQLLLCLDWFGPLLGKAALGEHFIAITEPKDNALRRVAARHGMRMLEHDPGIGGRYSVLSNVGLLPALVAGLDAAALREGAEAVLGATLAAAEPSHAAPALGAAVNIGLAERRGIGTAVLMPYIDRLAFFGLWFRQLWAESLGKDGKGTTPVRAMGTVDQHSQLQLYLGGPADKLFTLVTLAVAGVGGEMRGALSGDDAELDYLHGHRFGDLLDAEQRATAETLIKNGRPTRLFALPALAEKNLGALLMHFMLETIIAAELLGVDPFDQPAVEEGKVLARQFLGEKRRGGAQ
jgi:glucose-6-phosphate isomerase